MPLDIPFIGEYLSQGFANKSYWPPIGNVTNAPSTRVPIRSNQQLINFINTRRITANTKRNVYIWLSHILENRRATLCIANTAPTNPYELYHVRQVNKYGWNSVIEFLRNNVSLQKRILLPNKKKTRHTSYFQNCL